MAQKKRLRLREKYRKKVAGLTVVILIASFISIMLLTPAFNINKIKVHGNSVLSDEKIIQSAGIVKGVSIFGVSLARATKGVEEMGYIEKVKIKRRLPSTIEITVVEAVGVGYIPAENGYVVITADGRSIGTVTEAEDAQAGALPVIKGLKKVKYKIGSKIVGKDERQLSALIGFLKAFSSNGYIFDMTEIDVTSFSDITFMYGKGLKVRFGPDEKMDYKSEVFSSILAELGENPKGYLDLERQTYREEEIPEKTVE